MSGMRGLPSPRFSDSSPSCNQQDSNYRQPLYLPPNNSYLSPRGSRMSSPRNSLGMSSPRNSLGMGSPDFIPLGVSSPVSRFRHSWKPRNYSNNSSYSGPGSPTSTNSSPNFSPYRRHHGNSRGFQKDRRTGSFSSNHSGSGSSNISLYIDKEALEDPWAALEQLYNESNPPSPRQYSEECPVTDTQDTESLGSDD